MRNHKTTYFNTAMRRKDIRLHFIVIIYKEQKNTVHFDSNVRITVIIGLYLPLLAVTLRECSTLVCSTQLRATNDNSNHTNSAKMY